MTQITLDAGLAERLHHAGSSVELCDPDGKVVGRFVPLADLVQYGSVVDLSQWEPVGAGITEEELLRRSRSASPRYKLAEVIARLEQL